MARTGPGGAWGEVARIRSNTFIDCGLDEGSQSLFTRVRAGEAGMIRSRTVRKASGTHAHVAHELFPATACGRTPNAPVVRNTRTGSSPSPEGGVCRGPYQGQGSPSAPSAALTLAPLRGVSPQREMGNGALAVHAGLPRLRGYHCERGQQRRGSDRRWPRTWRRTPCGY